jgi:hypothetical protein
VHQVLPDGADREQHGDRRRALIGGPVADHDDLRPAARGPLGRATEGGERGPQPVNALGHVPDRVERDRGEAGHVAERGHLVLEQHRMLEPQHPGVGRPLQQRRAPAPEVHPERHHHRLAQRIDRRVGHLGEPLPEVGVRALRHRRQGRERRIVAHAPDRIGARCRPSARAPAADPRTHSRRPAAGRPAPRLRASGAPARDRAPGSPCTAPPTSRRDGGSRPARLASRFRTTSPDAVSTTSTSPGPTFPHSTTSRGSRSTSPTSEPATTSPSRGPCSGRAGDRCGPPRPRRSRRR